MELGSEANPCENFFQGCLIGEVEGEPWQWRRALNRAKLG